MVKQAAGDAHKPGDSDSLYKRLVDAVDEYAIYAVSPAGRILTWNVGAERDVGYAASEIVGHDLTVLYTADDSAAGLPARHLAEAQENGNAEFEGRRVKKDGTTFYARVAITALRSENGDVVALAHRMRNLTEVRVGSDDLRVSEERARLMIESVKDYAIFMLDPSGRISTWNAGAARIKGYRAEEIIGKHFSIFYPPDEAQWKPDEELQIALREGKYEEEGWRLRKDGSRFMASVVITPVRTSKGELAGYAKVTRDLTERRAAQEQAIAAARRLAIEEASREAAETRAREMRSLAQQLGMQATELEKQSLAAEKANKVKAEFLAAMSHELRTPLNAIGGYAQLMEMGIGGRVTEEQKVHLERIRRSQQHLLAVINDILNFSKIEAGQLDYNIGPVPLREVLVTGVSMVEPQSRKKSIRVIIGECSADVTALADTLKVEQIVLNLLSNAMKFTPEGGEVELTAGVGSTGTWLSVRDTGIGISDSDLKMIFAPFIQVGRSLASPKEGTGLGLAISRDLAKAMRGDLTAASEQGVGSTFTLTLPAAG
ncbi:MAG: PAS domain-containing sensor histidine kinase [Gemmatimonadaceae bacterium]